MKMRALSLALAIASVLSAAACKDDRLHIKKVLIDVDPVAVAAAVDREQVRRQVAEVLAGTRGVVVDDGKGDGDVLRVRVESFSRGVAPPAEALAEGHPNVAPPSTLSLSVDVASAGTTQLMGHALASAQGVIDPHALIEQALRDALTQVLDARGSNELPSDDLLVRLTAPTSSTSQKEQAMAALAARGERRATAGIVTLLRSGDDDLAGEALRALTVLKDPDAVDAVIEWSDRQPPAVRKLCIDAVRATGSDKGRPWLFTLSSGHPDADVQAYARAALAALGGPDEKNRVAAGG